jgi:hypothetical protein
VAILINHKITYAIEQIEDVATKELELAEPRPGRARRRRGGG